jgi:hypothetical protein
LAPIAVLLLPVVFELKEVATSVDGKKSKFEIISHASEENTDPWSIKEYKDWFNKNYGGGWIQLDNKNLEWITVLSKSESRDIKLKELGI